MGERAKLRDDSKGSRQIVYRKYDAREKEHGCNNTGEEKIEMIDRGNKRSDKKRQGSKHKPGEKTGDGGEDAQRRLD